jgi:hypothetical protein
VRRRLFYGDFRDFFRKRLSGLLELANTLSQALAQLRQLARTEYDQGGHQDEENLTKPNIFEESTRPPFR